MQAVSAARLREGARRLLVQRLRLVPPDADVRRYALPGAARATELRWRAWLRRRPTLSVEAYGATVAVEAREELLGCQLCGGRELQPLFAPGRPGRWGYRVVRCTGCGFLYRNPGIRPERLGDLYSGGNYAKFLTGDYARGRQDGYRRIMDRLRAAVRGGRRAAAARLRLRRRSVPRARPRARLRRARRRPVAGFGRGGARSPRRRQRASRRARGRAGDRRRRLRRRHAVVGARASAATRRRHRTGCAGCSRTTACC